MKTCAVFITHIISQNTLNIYDKYKNELNGKIDFYALICNGAHISNYDNINYMSDKFNKHFDNIEFFNKQSINDAGFTMHYYYRDGIKNDLCFYGHNFELALFQFVINHPNYERYWFIEYDVFYNGDIYDLIMYFDDKKYLDYVGSNLKKRKIKDKSFFLSIDFDETYQMFNPIFFMNKKCFDELINEYKTNNIYGHYEYLFPSLLIEYGYDVDCFNNYGFVVGKCEGDTNCSMQYAGYGKSLKLNNMQKNILYHPIK